MVSMRRIIATALVVSLVCAAALVPASAARASSDASLQPLAHASPVIVVGEDAAGAHVFVEQSSQEDVAVEAQVVTEDSEGEDEPVIQAQPQALLQHQAAATTNAAHEQAQAARGTDAQWTVPIYAAAKQPEVKKQAPAPAAAAAKEEEEQWIHPMKMPHAAPAAAAQQAPRLQQLEAQVLSEAKAASLAAAQANAKAALAAKAEAEAEAKAQALELQLRQLQAKLEEKLKQMPDAAPAAPAAPVEAPVAAAPAAATAAPAAAAAPAITVPEPSTPVPSIVATTQTLIVSQTVSPPSDDDVVVPINAPSEIVQVVDALYPEAPGPYVPPNNFWTEAESNPQQARAQRLLNKQYTTPGFYPKRSRTGFSCRSRASHPIQAPVFMNSYAGTPAYTCTVSPFLSGQAWDACHQAHQACYLSCQATQSKCDEAFQHCAMKACGTGVKSPLCTKAPLASATDPAKVEQNYATCVAHLLPVLQSRYFNTTSYGKCQSHACMCVATPAIERVPARTTPVLPPSALESWPFYAGPNEQPPASFEALDLSMLETSSRSQTLFDEIDARDFVPDVAGLNAAASAGSASDLTVVVADRPDVLAMSTASQVIGADYSSAADAARGSPHVRAGLVVAKGRRVLEHYIPTCARLAGGRLLGIFESHVGGDAARALPSHRLLMGVTQQGQGRGLIMSTSLLVQLFPNRIEVSNAWTPSLQRVNPLAIGVVTLQLWASVWEQELFYTLILSTLERLGESRVPVIFHTLEAQTSLEAAAPQMPTDPSLIEAGHVADPYVSAAESLLHAHATRSSGFWIESVEFQFPSSVVLVLKSSAPATQQLQLEVRAWSEAHAHANSSTVIPVDMRRFRTVLPAESAGEHAGEEMFLGSLRILTQRLEIEMSDTIDSVFILSNTAQPTSAHLQGHSSLAADAALAQADQVFTNLGYFFFFSAGTDSTRGAASGWAAGLPLAGGFAVPQLLSKPGSAMAPPARVVDGPRDPASLSHIVLPGSGILSVGREHAGATGVVGVSRSLTPLSSGVDLSNGYWGVSVMLRLLGGRSAESVTVQLQLESPSVTDYAFHKSAAIELRKGECWVHAQFAFDQFTAASGRALDLKQISKITLLAMVAGHEGKVSRVEVGAFAIQTAELSSAQRMELAPCSAPASSAAAPPMKHGMGHAGHAGHAGMMRSHSRSQSQHSLVESVTTAKKGAASATSAASLVAAMVVALLGLLAARV